MTFDSASKTMGRQPIELVNIETDACSLRFGVGACNATGEPCYNTWATCKARLAYVNTVKTYRFARSNAALPVGFSCLPLLQSVQYAPQVLTPAKGLGVRAAVTVRFTDTAWPDTADDPYFDQRPTGTEGQGTFFGRFRARNAFMFGRFLHVKTGYIVGGVLDDANLQTRSYIIESITGADRSGAVTFVAKDVLKLADDDKAQCPRFTSARLDADITDVQTSFIVYPAGIGNAEFPASGVLRIASELMTFTRSADTFTLSRGHYGTQAKAAKADDAIQLCAVFVNQPVQNLIYDLLVNYAKIPAAYIDKAAWDAERDANLLGVYSSVITDPVGVNTLISELSEQGQCYVWWDDVARLIRFKALTAPPEDLPILSDEDHFLHGSISAGEATADRVSRFLIRFDRIDPTKKLDDVANYRQWHMSPDLQSEGEREYRTAKTRIINSRWFNSGSLGRVTQLGAALLSRYRDPPLTFEADIDLSAGVKTGDLFRVSSRLFQDAAGSRKAVPMQIVESHEKAAGSILRLKAAQLVWAGEGVPVNPEIIIGSDLTNVNLRELYETEYGTPFQGQSVRFVLAAGINIYGLQSDPQFDFRYWPAVYTGLWPDSVDLTFVNRGNVVGFGGTGGYSDSFFFFANKGQMGGDAFSSRRTIYDPVDGFLSFEQSTTPLLLINEGVIAGGGGGGGAGLNAANGGGGAPFGAAFDGRGAQSGTFTVGGNGGGNGLGGIAGQGGRGGDWGQSGGNGDATWVTSDGTVISQGGLAGWVIDPTATDNIEMVNNGTLLGRVF